MRYTSFLGETMAKKQLSMKIDQQFADKLTNLAKTTGKTKTAIIEDAIMHAGEGDKHDRQQIELLSKQNEQLQLMMQATQAVITEKDNTIKSKNELISELRARRRTFWQWLFNLK